MEEDESISAQIDESSADNNSDDELIRMDDIEYIWDGSYLYLNMNTKDSRFKIHDHIRKSQNEWKGGELSANNMGKCLHKVF